MKIVIVGDGKVGLTLTEQLSAEGHDIVIIDRNQQVLRDSQEAYDVMVVKRERRQYAGAERSRG